MTDERTNLDTTTDDNRASTGGRSLSPQTQSGGDQSDSGARATASGFIGQAGERMRTLADDGKERATTALDDLAKMMEDAAGQVDEKLGEKFGGYARQASGAVQSLSGAIRDKNVDDIVEDARVFVQKSPAIAIGAAAALGFVLARVLRSGIDSDRA